MSALSEYRPTVPSQTPGVELQPQVASVVVNAFRAAFASDLGAAPVAPPHGQIRQKRS